MVRFVGDVTFKLSLTLKVFLLFVYNMLYSMSNFGTFLCLFAIFN
jgi:hypothetical protein